jgi:hypothetical protein
MIYFHAAYALEMWEKAALDGAASGVGSKIDVVMCILR